MSVDGRATDVWALKWHAMSFVKMSLTSEQVEAIRALNALRKLNELECEELRKLRKRPAYWVNPFLEKRCLYSLEGNILADLLWEDGSNFKNFCRLSINSFEQLLEKVEGKISRQDTIMRSAIPSRTRLAITLRYLATGDSFRSLEFLTRVSRKTISDFIPNVFSAIYDALQSDYLKMPSTEEEWLQIAEDFDNVWDFPHTIGSIDGKHIRINAPPSSGSDFYNYKRFFSVVLLAVVNAHSKFVYINVGANGRASDTQVFSNCSFYHLLKEDKCNLPRPSPLAGQQDTTPFFLIGDDIFALDKHLMKAYNRNISLSSMQQIFNYRLSRARLTVEMAFGRLASRFRVFHRPIAVKLETVDQIVKSCCVLHNYLTKELIKPFAVEDFSDSGEPLPQTITPLPVQEYKTYLRAPQICANIAKYCMTDGAVEYQWRQIKTSVA